MPIFPILTSAIQPENINSGIENSSQLSWLSWQLAAVALIFFIPFLIFIFITQYLLNLSQKKWQILNMSKNNINKNTWIFNNSSSPLLKYFFWKMFDNILALIFTFIWIISIAILISPLFNYNNEIFFSYILSWWIILYILLIIIIPVVIYKKYKNTKWNIRYNNNEIIEYFSLTNKYEIKEWKINFLELLKIYKNIWYQFKQELKKIRKDNDKNWRAPQNYNHSFFWEDDIPYNLPDEEENLEKILLKWYEKYNNLKIETYEIIINDEKIIKLLAKNSNEPIIIIIPKFLIKDYLLLANNVQLLEYYIYDILWKNITKNISAEKLNALSKEKISLDLVTYILNKELENKNSLFYNILHNNEWIETIYNLAEKNIDSKIPQNTKNITNELFENWLKNRMQEIEKL